MQFVIHSGLLYEYIYNVKCEASRGSIKSGHKPYYGTDFREFAPACALDGQDAFALNELFNDVALTWMKAGGM